MAVTRKAEGVWVLSGGKIPVGERIFGAGGGLKNQNGGKRSFSGVRVRGTGKGGQGKAKVKGGNRNHVRGICGRKEKFARRTLLNSKV